jgi:hypothetical protein
MKITNKKLNNVKISHRILRHEEWGIISICSIDNLNTIKLEVCYIANNCFFKCEDLEDLNNKIEKCIYA